MLFNGPASFAAQATFSFLLGAAFSGTIFVNLAGYHVKSVAGDLTGRASGIFVTSLYGSAAAAGYVIGWLAHQFGWATASSIQLVLLCVLAAAISLLVQPNSMAKRV